MKEIDISNPALGTSCRAAALEVLEMMFFELPVAEPCLADHPEKPALVARVEFEGSLRGTLCVAVTAGCFGTLTAGFLGVDEPEVNDAERNAMLLELANMFCGATMSRLEPSGKLRIAQPVHAAEGDTLSGPWLTFPLECGSVSVAMRYQVPE